MAYADLGWQVFPVHCVVDVDQCSCGSGGCGHQGKHPVTINGLKAATDDEDQIRDWWDEHPLANVGIATGSSSQFWTLDVDVRDNGIEQLEKLVAELGADDRPLESTVQQFTGSGGRHYLFAWDDEVGDVRNRTNVLPGIDVRGEGGYIIVPPSNHLSGNQYAWIEGYDPFRLMPAAAPPWLLELVLSEKSGGTATQAARDPSEDPHRSPLGARGQIDPLGSQCDRSELRS